ncbi:transcriptional regulator, BadM/Rrf2 family [Orenia metallireducens]|jgi:Rrf2 family protein|uniref:Transcriptional regulator, BadM/Rrf2 family n=1 Tax=Orenia metallireducens TaxID=1413210 RepID=A0A285IHV0_9FIRM|nr:Rrf2 family transcriptional regulator [Orenia metallireducens]SNY47367.1 transcriptional regulator, BadM/Rrf2 family [Orenia metallireducens]
MKLSRECEYAILALIDMAKDKENLIKINDIAERNGIPKKFLEQILLTLKRTGYVSSKRGIGGGYKLIKKANKITIAEIARLFDGALAPVESVSKNFYEETPIEKNQKLLFIFKEIRDYISNKLENITIYDLLEE